MAFSHPYEEPSLIVILELVGFLLLLNVVHKTLDSFLYCGLVGQVLVGVLFGTPGAKLLDDASETVISNLGYLGLLLLVYQGGLSTSLSGLVSASLLSILVALTGISLPIALSFLLLPLGASPLQCFSAGAALSATSLGTAFATLSSSGLLDTHVGTVLTSAAMLDDVVGLIMLQVVSELSTGHRTASDYGKVVGRALGASLGLVVLVVISCRVILRPLYKPVHAWVHSAKRGHAVKIIWRGRYTHLAVHTAFLLILIVAGSYAGTSVLLAAFVAGVVIRWWDDEVTTSIKLAQASNSESTHPQARPPHQTGLQVYEDFYGPSTDQILKPFFFASIGFSIPITQMFHGVIVWKGLVYALLMFLGKVATGLWLVPSSLEATTRAQIVRSLKLSRRRKAGIDPKAKPVDPKPNGEKTKPPTENGMTDKTAASAISGRQPVPGQVTETAHTCKKDETSDQSPTQAKPTAPTEPTRHTMDCRTADSSGIAASSAQPVPESSEEQVTAPHNGRTPPAQAKTSALTEPTQNTMDCATADSSGITASSAQPVLEPSEEHVTALHNGAPPLAHAAPRPASHTRPKDGPPPTARALRAYAPALLGLAMTARGEIGFLIASVAESRGVFASASTSVSGTSELYLVAVWAIVLCTMGGPVAVGGLVRRVKRLERSAHS